MTEAQSLRLSLLRKRSLKSKYAKGKLKKLAHLLQKRTVPLLIRLGGRGLLAGKIGARRILRSICRRRSIGIINWRLLRLHATLLLLWRRKLLLLPSVRDCRSDSSGGSII